MLRAQKHTYLKRFFVKPSSSSLKIEHLKQFAQKLDADLTHHYNPPTKVFGDILNQNIDIRRNAIKNLSDKISNMSKTECEVFVKQIDSLRNAQYSTSPCCTFFPLNQNMLNRPNTEKSFLKTNEIIMQLQEEAEEHLRGFTI